MKNDNNTPSRILILSDNIEASVEGEKGLWNASQMSRKVGEVQTSELAKNVSAFCDEIGKMFGGVKTTIENYELDEFEVSATINAKGEIALIGSIGGEITGGIKLIFKRQKHT